MENKTKESNSLNWWNDLSKEDRAVLLSEYRNTTLHIGVINNVTNQEIKQLYYNEVIEPNKTTQVVRDAMEAVSKDVRPPKVVRDRILKPNQKQFKEFNSELFKAYIDKFSDEDKVAALRVLFKEIGITSKDKLEYYLAKY